MLAEVARVLLQQNAIPQQQAVQMDAVPSPGKQVGQA
jgi:hypothetical protein